MTEGSISRTLLNYHCYYYYKILGVQKSIIYGSCGVGVGVGVATHKQDSLTVAPDTHHIRNGTQHVSDSRCEQSKADTISTIC